MHSPGGRSCWPPLIEGTTKSPPFEGVIGLLDALWRRSGYSRHIHPVNANIPPDQISLSNLACLNRILAYTNYFAWKRGLRSTGSSDATNDICCCCTDQCHPGARAFLVSTHVLRQHGLLPGC